MKLKQFKILIYYYIKLFCNKKKINLLCIFFYFIFNLFLFFINKLYINYVSNFYKIIIKKCIFSIFICNMPALYPYIVPYIDTNVYIITVALSFISIIKTIEYIV